MDIDCEVSENYLAAFALAIASQAEFATAQRIYRLTPYPYVLVRHILSVVYRWLLPRIIRIHTPDTEAGYKFFSRNAADYVLTNSKFNDWFWDTEVCFLMENGGFTIVNIPVAFVQNPNKTSTVKIFTDSLKCLKSLFVFLSLRRRAKYPAPGLRSKTGGQKHKVA
jgi:hypothetical protein